MSLRGLAYLRSTWPLFRRDWKQRGTRAMLVDLYRMREFRWGELKGVDENGNRYYENNNHATNMRRWVLYPSWPWRGAVDPANVTPEWHMWLHQQVEETPEQMTLPHHRWMLPARKGSYLSQYGLSSDYMPKGYYARQVSDHPSVFDTLHGKPEQLRVPSPVEQEAAYARQEAERSPVAAQEHSTGQGFLPLGTVIPSHPPPHRNDPLSGKQPRLTDLNDGDPDMVPSVHALYEPWTKEKMQLKDREHLPQEVK